MSSGRRKFAVRQPVVVDIGCGCRRPKMPSFLSPVLPKPKLTKNRTYFSPTATTTATTNSLWEPSLAGATTSSSSPSRYDYTSSPSFSVLQSPRSQRRTMSKEEKSPMITTTTKGESNDKTTKMISKKGLVEESTVAVVKESTDPYVDFRESMFQMIVEMEIDEWEDLRDLLHRFLSLNSPIHHHIILRAFAEIWHALFSSTPTPSPSSLASSSGTSSTSAIHRPR